MKFVVRISLPVQPFNAFVREGTAGQKIGRILEETRPEAVYFTTTPEGMRGGVLIYEMTDASQLPAVAEPWFLTFNATINAAPCMSPDDLAKASLDGLGKAWA